MHITYGQDQVLPNRHMMAIGRWKYDFQVPWAMQFLNWPPASVVFWGHLNLCED